MLNDTQLTGSKQSRKPTPMEERVANCEAIVAAFTLLDSLKSVEDEASVDYLLMNSAKLAPTIADC